jgi:hypothetical protein
VNSLGDRIGVIFHEEWNYFSPMLYSHYGANSIPIQLQEYLREYTTINSKELCTGHIYNSKHMMVEFLQSIEKDIHLRVQNLSEGSEAILRKDNEYLNCFEGGCWIVDVSKRNFGDTICSGGVNYYLQYNNIVNDELLHNNY